MTDYRINYISQQVEAGEMFKLEIKPDMFIFHGDKGTNLEMKPILPRKLIVPNSSEGSEMVITKDRFMVRNIREKRAKQEKIPGVLETE